MRNSTVTGPRPRTGPGFYTRWVEEWWLAEFAAAGASCVLSIVLSIILWRFNGQPVPNFGSVLSSGITLGTVATVITTVIVASAVAAIQECLGQLKWLWFQARSQPLRDVEIYDRASRGPVGSMRLLARLRVGRSPVASLGAFLMIAQLLVTPLVQQSIVYVASNVPDDSPSAAASVPTSQWWYDDSPLGSGDTAVLSGDTATTYTSMGAPIKGAVMNGLYSSTTSLLNDTAPLCSSGNCTFPDYATLGICAHAANVTAHLSTTGNYSQMNEVSCLPGDFCLYQDMDGDAVANVTTSTELSRNLQINGSSFDAVAVPLNFTSLAFANLSNPLTDVYVIYTNDMEGYNAVEFVLDWCVPTFSSKVVNGVAASARTAIAPLDLRYQPSDEANHPPGLLVDTVDGVAYTVELSAHATIQRYFQRLLNGKALFSQSYLVDNDQVEVVGDALNIFGAPDPTGRNPVPSTNLSALHTLLDNIATSMTNVIRTSSNETLTDGTEWIGSGPIHVHGTASVLQNTVRIYWGWVVPPMLFSVLSLLLVTLVASRRGKRASQRPAHGRAASAHPCVWKTSQLAALRGLDLELQELLGGLGRRADLDSSAKSVHVRLELDGDRWRLVRVEQALPVNEGDTPQRVRHGDGLDKPMMNAHSVPQTL